MSNNSAHRASARAKILIRPLLAIALTSLALPLASASAYADDPAAAEPTVAAAEATPTVESSSDPAPPPEETPPAPAPEPAAEPAPEPAGEEPASEEPAPAPAKPPAEEPADEPAPGPAPRKATQELVVQAEPAAAPDCTVVGFSQNTQEDSGGSWINGALNQNNSNYAEGDFVPQRIELDGLVPGTYTVGFTYDRMKGDKFAYDFVDFLAISGSTGASASWDAEASDPPMPAVETVGVTITFTITDASDSTAVLTWGGHIASELDYGPGTGAGSISGAPYHFSVVATGGEFGCDSGQRDNQLMADAVDFATLTVVKDAQPNSDQPFRFGIAAPNDLAASFDLTDNGSGQQSVTYHVPPGTTTVTETPVDGWTLTDITCTPIAGTTSGPSVSLVLADDDLTTCTFTNARTSSIEVDKFWVINGADPVPEGQEPAHLELGAQLLLDGDPKAWDTEHGGFLQGSTVRINEQVTFGNPLCDWTGASRGRLTSANGAATDAALPYDATLTGGANRYAITNTVTCDGALVLRKVVQNDNGGSAVPGDFTLVATPGAGEALETAGSTDGTRFVVAAGSSYDLSESAIPAGYSLAGIDCGGGSTTTATVPAGRTVTCTFTNVDSPGSLVLEKIVDANDTGDDTPASAWHLSATPVGIADQATIEGAGGASGSTKAGTYSLAESGPATHTSGDWTCRDDDGAIPVNSGQVNVGVGENVICSVTNTAIAPTLTLVKIVDPGDTGDDTGADAFTLTATPVGILGQGPLSGPGPEVTDTVKVGGYTLDETGPGSYEPDEAGWSCVDADGPVPVNADDQVQVGLAQDVTCTITNVAVPSSWMVEKSSDPVSGSTVMPGDVIDYTVTLTKVGDGVAVRDFEVIDTLEGIDPTWVSGLVTDTGSAELGDDGVITWSVDVLGDAVLTMTYSVTVGEDAWGATLRNVVTPGPEECPDPAPADPLVDCDETTHVTPHHTLDKAVTHLATPGDGDDVVEPGERLEYSLTVVNDTEHAVLDTVVSDDLSDVLDNATMVSTPAQLAAQGLALTGTELTWTITGLAPGDSLTVSYVVEVKAGAWDQVLRNVATPGESGECIPPAGALECETTTRTPPVTTMVVEKRDLETDEVLAGATFELYADEDNALDGEGNCTFADPPVVGAGDELLGSANTGDDGQVLFTDLQHGCYLLVETVAPPGYALPDNPILGIQVDEANFVAGGEMSPIVVTDFAEGQLAIVAKRQFELIGGDWVESDGEVDFGDQIKYVVRVEATGPKNFHDVLVSDYVPGFNPDDVTSTVEATLVPGSPVCGGGLTCTTSVDPATQLVTWDIGDLEPDVGSTIGGTVEMVVEFPPPPPLEAGESAEATLWNVAFLSWSEVVGVADGGAGAFELVEHLLRSNEVVVSAFLELPPAAGEVPEPPAPGPGPGPGPAPGPGSLPDTGAPDGLGTLVLLGGALVGLGLLLSRRRTRS